MNRRPTWIMLGLLAVALLVLAFFEWTPQGKQISQTPTPTSPPTLLSGWDAERIVRIQIQQSGQSEFVLSRPSGGLWVAENESSAINQETVSFLLNSITSASIRSSLSNDLAQDVTGLAEPILFLSLQDTFGAKVEIKIGLQTPISSGYYVQVNSDSPVVAGKYEIEDVLSISSLQALILPQPTP